RNDVPSRIGLLATNHRFGGFYRSIELEATPEVYIDDVWARGDFAKKSAIVEIDVRKAIDGEESVPVDSSRIRCVIEDSAGNVVGETEINDYKNGSKLEIPIKNCRFWTPENPILYTINTTLKDEFGKETTGWVERFGVRELKVVGRNFYLNGKPYFLRGAGDHNYDQINLFEPADRERFKEHMAIYKEAGFNYARFHTHSPFPEYFEAADEMGILLQPELPYYHDFPTEGFSFDPKRDAYELFRTNRRYVSFATYSFGNEGHLGSPLDVQLYRWLKTIDPERLIIHEDGGRITRENSDYTSNAHGHSLINPWPEGYLSEVETPVVAHEYLNLSIKMDPRYEPRFTGIRVAPVSIENWKNALAACGLDENWGAKTIAAAEALQGIYQKKGLELARIDPDCDGYLFWSLVDASIPQGPCVAAQGYLNPFWEPRPNGVAPKDFYKFNGPTVLLLKTDAAAPILVSGDKLAAEFWISHYDVDAIAKGELIWTLFDDKTGKTLATGKLPVDEIVPGTVGKIAAKTIEIPALDRAVAARLSFSIPSVKVENSQKFWLFPKRVKKSLAGFAVSEALYDRIVKLYDDVELIELDDGRDASPNDGKIWLVDPADEAFVVGVKSGRKVVAVSVAAPIPNVALGWWSIGSQVGVAFADSPAFAAFPNGAWMDELWFRLVRADAPDMRSKPLSGFCEPLAVGEGRDSYYLYVGQTKCGSAKILQTFALDLTQDAPEATALLDSLLDYVASDQFAPKTEVKDFNPGADSYVPDGTIWGYGKALSGERYVGPSLYADAAVAATCRQNETEGAVEWVSAQKPKNWRPNADKTTTFQFVGGLGYWCIGLGGLLLRFVDYNG
ncbi:MAG: hypothetical protein HUK22_08155, partial [Thermoguttaceae bacterium]|nr:hypothetical protein [Thermoguttaceae bacterium]